MAAYADLSEFVNRKTGGNSGAPEFFLVTKDSRVGGAAAAAPIIGRWVSAWEYEGSPSHGAPPGAVAAPDNTTVGSFAHTSPGGGRTKWLDFVLASVGSAATIMIYDRLLHVSGFDGTSIVNQSVGGSLTRNTGGKGNLLFVEIYTQIGTTATTITANYTDQDGNSGITSAAAAIGGTGLREAQRLIPIPLAAGDSGVRAVSSVILAATTGTAGNFGITVARPIAIIGCPSSCLPGVRSFLDGALADISTSCLSAAYLPQTATVQTLMSFFCSAAER